MITTVQPATRAPCQFLAVALLLALLAAAPPLSAADPDLGKLFTASGAGDANAQYHLGYLYNTGGGGLVKDEVKAVTYYRQAADQGYAEAQFYLGKAYEHGQGGLAEDLKKALTLHAQAANQKLRSGAVHTRA